jgi:putative methyltransferase
MKRKGENSNYNERAPKWNRPRMTLHEEAASFLETVAKRKGGIRTLNLEDCVNNRSAIYALVTQSMKNSDVLQSVIENTNIISEWGGTESNSLFKVLLYDILYGQGLRGRTELERYLITITDKIKSSFKELSNGVKGEPPPEQPGPSSYLRFVRVNTLLKSVEECLTVLESEGFKKVDTVTPADRSKQIFSVDSLIPEILIFPPSISLHHHPLKKSGALILQDKASCFPVHALRPRSHWHVIDACAAPGSKTIHLASIMENNGKIFAFDLDPQRVPLLQKTVERAGATNVESKCADFLKIDPNDPQYSQVRGILLDPSCSGSGTVFYKQESKSLEKLASLQTALIHHALKFPNVKRVVYSTCSINQEENEEVVKNILSQNPQWRLSRALPTWERRGFTSVLDGADKCIRTDPKEDNLLGFFVACFGRRKRIPFEEEATHAVVNGKEEE